MRFQVGATELASLALCESANTPAWMAGIVDLSAYAGQTITITFQVTTDPAGEDQQLLHRRCFSFPQPVRFQKRCAGQVLILLYPVVSMENKRAG